MSETIFSLSSGGLPAGVAIIRISGDRTRFALETIFGSIPPPRHAAYGEFRDSTGNLIDRGLTLYFPGPYSFTGEDCGEFHIHGSRAAASFMLSVLGRITGLRQAEPGEFTRRAFENGKMDLTEVEGLADLLAAETEMQRRVALDQAGGNLRRLYEGWMQRLTHARAMLEAELDFADEQDIPGSVSDTIWPDIRALASEMRSHMSGLHQGEIIRDGYKVALIGAPNVGKSTLLNRLADRDVAIVSDVPGTTRDALEVRLDIAGHLVIVSDTAGIRETADAIENEGIKRSLRAAEAADLILRLNDGTTQIADYGDVLPGDKIVDIRTKCDLVERSATDSQIAISAKTGEGLNRLIELVADRLSDIGVSHSAYPTRARHRELIEEALSHIEASLAAGPIGAEIVAHELSTASIALGRIVGRVDVEDLLGVIFSEFCVGK